jgi:hypothetical protein
MDCLLPEVRLRQGEVCRDEYEEEKYVAKSRSIIIPRWSDMAGQLSGKVDILDAFMPYKDEVYVAVRCLSRGVGTPSNQLDEGVIHTALHPQPFDGKRFDCWEFSEAFVMRLISVNH